MPRVRAFVRIGEETAWNGGEQRNIFRRVCRGGERDGRFIRNRGVAFLGTLGTRSPPPGEGRIAGRGGGGGFSGLNAIKVVIRCRRWRFLRDDVDALVCHRATSSRGLHDLLPLPSFRALRFLPPIFLPPSRPSPAPISILTREIFHPRRPSVQFCFLFFLKKQQAVNGYKFTQIFGKLISI